MTCNCENCRPESWPWPESYTKWVRDNREALAPENDDPWSHRSEGMLCETCMWYVPKYDEDNDETIIGRCRRHAPTISGYPIVFMHDWCGDHRLDENKL